MIETKRTAHDERRYEVRLRTPDGKERSKTFRTKKQAETYEATQKADRARGTWIDPRDSATPFARVADEWLKSNPGKREGTSARDEGVVRVHLTELGPRRIGSITSRDIQTLVNGWAKTHRPRSVRRMFGVLRAILAYAVERDYIGRSPCRGVKLPEVVPTGRPLVERVVTGDGLAQLADAIGPEYAPMVYVACVLGLRWGEVAGLRVGRLDFLRGVVNVAEQITRGSHGVVVHAEPKSEAGRRILAAPQGLMLILADHLARHGLTGANDDALVFTSPDGEPLRYENWRRRVWLPAVSSAGLGGLTFHDLRRAGASALVLDGVDIKTAQTRLGHSDPRLTLAIYAQAMSEADRAAAETLGARFAVQYRPGTRVAAPLGN